MKNLRKKQFYWFLTVFVIAIALKLFTLYEVSKLEYCNLYLQPHDSFFNIRSAETPLNPAIDIKISSFVPNTAYKPFLKGMFFLFGKNLTAIRFIQLLLSSYIIFILLKIGLILKEKYLSTILIFLWVFTQNITLFDLQILKYSFNISFTMLAIYSVYKYSQRTSLINLILSLSSIIILSSFRPIYIFSILLLIQIKSQDLNSKVLKTTMNVILLLSIPFTIFCWLLFASDKSKTHVGIHMYKGFNSLSTGFYESTPFVRDNSLGHMKEAVYIGKKLSQDFENYKFIENFWLQKTLTFFIDKPLQSLRLIFIKSINLLFYDNFDDTIDILNLKKSSFFLKIFFIKINFLLPFAIIGLISVTFTKKQNYLINIINTFFVLQFVSVIITCLSSRYQAQLLPYIILYAGIGICNIIKNIQNKNRTILYIFIFIITFFLNYKINHVNNDYQIRNRTSYHNFRIRKYKIAQKSFKSLIQDQTSISFVTFQKMCQNFLESLSTIDTQIAIKIWLTKKDLTLEEQLWCFETSGDVNLRDKQYHKAIKNYQLALKIRNSDPVQKKISRAKELLFLSEKVASYR